LSIRALGTNTDVGMTRQIISSICILLSSASQLLHCRNTHRDTWWICTSSSNSWAESTSDFWQWNCSITILPSQSFLRNSSIAFITKRERKRNGRFVLKGRPRRRLPMQGTGRHQGPWLLFAPYQGATR
jgi:hypothetical protein